MIANKKAYYAIASVVFLFLCHKLGLFTGGLGIESNHSIALAILLVAGVLWVTEWLPLYVTSLTILLLQIIWLYPGLSQGGVKISRQDFYSPFFSDIILLFLGGFVLASLLHTYRIDDRIASWLLRRTGTKPGAVMMGIMVVCAVLSMWMSNTATTAMMFAIVLPILASIPEENPFRKALVISIPFACNLGGLGTPIGTPPNAIALSYLAAKGVRLGFGSWMLATLPFLILFMGFVWFMLLKLYPPGDIAVEVPFKEAHPWKGTDILVVCIFGLTILGWLTGKSHGLTTGTIGLFPLVASFGLGLLKTKDFKALPWDVLFMVGGGICLGVGLEKSGLTSQIARLIPAGAHNLWVPIAFLIVAAIMTTFMSNTATANLLIPLGVSLDPPIGALVIGIAMTCSTAMALPVSTPPNAIAFGSGFLTAKDMVIPGLAITIVSLVALLLLGNLYWPMVGIK